MTDADDQEGAPPVAVMSYRIWKGKYGSDPSVVGASYQINGHPFTVIGVAAPGFYGAKLAGGGMPDFWLPLTAELMIDGATCTAEEAEWQLPGHHRKGASGSESKLLEAELRVELHNWLASHVPDMDPGEKQLWQQQTLHLTPGGAGVAAMRDQYQDGLKLLLVAAGCVLLVACGESGESHAGAWVERPRADIRAHGAGCFARSDWCARRWWSPCCCPSLEGAVGIAVAYAGTRLILHLAFQAGGPNNYVPIDATPSLPVLLFTLGMSVLTGIVFGIAPAWITSHADPVEALRGAGRSVSGGRSWAQKSLVIGQAAMSLVLLSAAALLGQSLRNLEHQNFGFETEGRYIAWINPMLGNYKPEQLEPMFRQIDERLLQIPGVRMVAPALYAPMTGDSWNDGIRVEGRPEPGAKEDTGAAWARVMPGFFETLGAKIVLGRPIADEDTAGDTKSSRDQRSFCKEVLQRPKPDRAAFRHRQDQVFGHIRNRRSYKDMRYMTYGYKDPVRPMFWLPEAQTVQYDDTAFVSGEIWSHYLYNIVIWAPGNPPGMEDRVRKALASVDPNLVLYGVDPYTKVVSADFQQENMIATLTTLFGVLGLLLAAVGLYGVMAYTVEQRTSEIGVRMALGADRGGVVKMVLRGAFSQVGIGLALGIPAAIGAGKLMSEATFSG